MVHQVKSKTEFETKLTEAGDKLVVVDFFATWCGACKMIAPKLNEMVSEYPDIVFLKVDIDECEDIVNDYNISVVPSFSFVKSGQRMKEEVIGSDPEKLKETMLKLK